MSECRRSELVSLPTEFAGLRVQSCSNKNADCSRCSRAATPTSVISQDHLCSWLLSAPAWCPKVLGRPRAADVTHFWSIPGMPQRPGVFYGQRPEGLSSGGFKFARKRSSRRRIVQVMSLDMSFACLAKAAAWVQKQYSRAMHACAMRTRSVVLLKVRAVLRGPINTRSDHAGDHQDCEVQSLGCNTSNPRRLDGPRGCTECA